MKRAVTKPAKRFPAFFFGGTAACPQAKQLVSCVRRMPLQDRHRVIHRLKRVEL